MSREHLVQPRHSFLDDPSTGASRRLAEIPQHPFTNRCPFVPASLPDQHAGQRWRRLARFAEAEREPAVTVANDVQLAIEDHAAGIDQRHMVSDAFHLVEQVRGKQYGAPLAGHGADDGRQDVSPGERVEST